MTKEKNSVNVTTEKKNVKSASGIASVSFLISLLDRFGFFLRNAIIFGFFGRIFTSYSRFQSKFEKSISGKTLFGNHKVRRFFRKVRKFLSTVIDSSYFTQKSKRTVNYLCSIPLNFYGNFSLFFGLYTLVVYVVKLFLIDVAEADDSYIFVGICLVIASIPTLFSKTSLAGSVKKSFIFSLIFSDAFGFSDQNFVENKVKVKGRGNYMLFLGLLVGMLTFFVHPLTILAVISVIILLLLIASAPEIGVLITIVFLPFLSFFENPTIVLCVLICITWTFYMLKLLRGKRVFKLELLDLFVLVFGVTIFASSFFSAGGETSFSSAAVAIILLLGYFLVVNLMRTLRWVKRCVLGLISSATIVAAVGIIEYFFAESSGEWLDLSLFSDIRLRVVSFFGNPNVLSAFLVMIFPFVLAILSLSKRKNEKILSFLAALMIVACTVFTWSRGAWLAIILCTLIFFIMCKPKTFRIFGAALLVIPALPLLLPNTVTNRLLSIVNLSDSSISYRLYTWEGTTAAIKDNMLGGIGFGNEAFQNIYPKYAYAGMETAEHSHSLFLQIFLALGIVGIVVFAIVLFFSFQKMFEYVKNPENTESKIYTVAVIASLIASIVMGVFDYIWYNYRVMYIFWIIIAIGCAAVRVGNYERNRKKETDDYTEQM